MREFPGTTFMSDPNGVEGKLKRRQQDLELGEVLQRFATKPKPLPEPEPSTLPDPFLNWSTFWDRDRTDAEWIYEGVLARGRGHAIYASHKAGKSLFVLSSMAELATGKEPVVVVYLDYEMGEDDVYERLQEMGYGPETDLSRLRYAVLPSLTDLDTAEGAEAIVAVLDRVQEERPDHHLVVVFDTTARAVRGAEDKADTYRDFYSHTGIELKRRGVTWLRLDHAGKDVSRGQRGSSSKGDDVDVVWKLVRSENGVQLFRDAARMSWVPEKVTFAMTESPLRFRPVVGDVPIGTNETADLLDKLGVAIDASSRTAVAALKEAGKPRRRQVVVAALKQRRECLAEEENRLVFEEENPLGTTPGTTLLTKTGTGSGNQREPTPGTTREPPGTTLPGSTGTSVPPIRGTGFHGHLGTDPKGPFRRCPKCGRGIHRDSNHQCDVEV